MNYCYVKPSSFIRELQNELLGLHQHQTADLAHHTWAPKVDIKEEANEFIVFADIPGVDPKDIQIDMDGNTLTVKGEKKLFKEEKEKNYYRQERTSGKFYRQFTLPETIDADKITAKAKQGVLAIHLPKAIEENKQRKITVQEVE